MEMFDIRKEEWIKIEFPECNKIKFSTVLSNHKLLLIGGLRLYVPSNTVRNISIKIY